MNKKNTQLVLVEFRNYCGAPFLYRVVSEKPITIDSVARYFKETEGWNEERDSITFLDNVTQLIDLDVQIVNE